MTTRFGLSIAAFVLVACVFVSGAVADTWTEGLAGASLSYTEGNLNPHSSSTMFGRSFTLPASSPLAGKLWFTGFTWYTRQIDDVMPTGAGVLYLLDQEYNGLPANLSAATPGYLATSSAYAGGLYAFNMADPIVFDKTYWVYMKDGTLSPSQVGYGLVSGVTSYNDLGISGNYAGTADAGLNYEAFFSTPEPGTLSLLGLALGGAAYARRRKARKQQAA